MNKWYFIYSGHLPPALNMAIDETLLDILSVSTTPLLRIYGWDPHSFSLGYSQNPESVLYTDKCREDNIPFVKRATGGGIIFHGDEVTYSIACTEEDIGSPISVKDAYKRICSFLIETYIRFGLNPFFAIDGPESKKIKSSFCFSSFEDYDILLEGKKIGGNAQKRKKKMIMQHGSIPLSLNIPLVSRYVKEPILPAERRATSMKEILGRKISFEEFAGVMKESFISVFNVELEELKFSEEQRILIEKNLTVVKNRTI